MISPRTEGAVPLGWDRWRWGGWGWSLSGYAASEAAAFRRLQRARPRGRQRQSSRSTIAFAEIWEEIGQRCRSCSWDNRPSICRRSDSHTCFFFFLFPFFFFFVYLETSLFPSIFYYHFRFLFVWTIEYVVRSFLPDGVFSIL